MRESIINNNIDIAELQMTIIQNPNLINKILKPPLYLVSKSLQVEEKNVISVWVGKVDRFNILLYIYVY